MLLTKAEIEKIVDDLDAGLKTLATPEQVAHAIAERLAEGMVFEESGIIHGLTYGEVGRRLRVVNTDRMQLNVYDNLEDVPDGQRVSVIVTAMNGLQTETQPPEVDKEQGDGS